jgi:hypothetical protein
MCVPLGGLGQRPVLMHAAPMLFPFGCCAVLVCVCVGLHAQMDRLVKTKTAEREAALRDDYEGRVKALKER